MVSTILKKKKKRYSPPATWGAGWKQMICRRKTIATERYSHQLQSLSNQLARVPEPGMEFAMTSSFAITLGQMLLLQPPWIWDGKCYFTQYIIHTWRLRITPWSGPCNTTYLDNTSSASNISENALKTWPSQNHEEIEQLPKRFRKVVQSRGKYFDDNELILDRLNSLYYSGIETKYNPNTQI